MFWYRVTSCRYLPDRMSFRDASTEVAKVCDPQTAR